MLTRPTSPGTICAGRYFSMSFINPSLMQPHPPSQQSETTPDSEARYQPSQELFEMSDAVPPDAFEPRREVPLKVERRHLLEPPLLRDAILRDRPGDLPHQA